MYGFRSSCITSLFNALIFIIHLSVLVVDNLTAVGIVIINRSFQYNFMRDNPPLEVTLLAVESQTGEHPVRLSFVPILHTSHYRSLTSASEGASAI
jgi:hypothetical protein